MQLRAQNDCSTAVFYQHRSEPATLSCCMLLQGMVHTCSLQLNQKMDAALASGDVIRETYYQRRTGIRDYRQWADASARGGLVKQRPVVTQHALVLRRHDASTLPHPLLQSGRPAQRAAAERTWTHMNVFVSPSNRDMRSAVALARHGIPRRSNTCQR
ncbi:hypothetical protein CRENBAI_000776 [Crenichthys baileyi]|uniref:Uncharacterized protein n=1 Tax=Crenichthys baileyi TaxID=28760 RepID=A0AAV9RHD5_9TELE